MVIFFREIKMIRLQEYYLSVFIFSKLSQVGFVNIFMRRYSDGFFS
jgi:hypothetical protein